MSASSDETIRSKLFGLYAHYGYERLSMVCSRPDKIGRAASRIVLGGIEPTEWAVYSNGPDTSEWPIIKDEPPAWTDLRRYYLGKGSIRRACVIGTNRELLLEQQRKNGGLLAVAFTVRAFGQEAVVAGMTKTGMADHGGDTYAALRAGQISRSATLGLLGVNSFEPAEDGTRLITAEPVEISTVAAEYNTVVQ